MCLCVRAAYAPYSILRSGCWNKSWTFQIGFILNFPFFSRIFFVHMLYLCVILFFSQKKRQTGKSLCWLLFVVAAQNRDVAGVTITVFVMNKNKMDTSHKKAVCARVGSIYVLIWNAMQMGRSTLQPKHLHLLCVSALAQWYYVYLLHWISHSWNASAVAVVVAVAAVALQIQRYKPCVCADHFREID